MYYSSGTGGRCCIGAVQMLRVHFTALKDAMAQWWLFTGRTILPNFIPIRFETPEL